MDDWEIKGIHVAPRPDGSYELASPAQAHRSSGSPGPISSLTSLLQRVRLIIRLPGLTLPVTYNGSVSKRHIDVRACTGNLSMPFLFSGRESWGCPRFLLWRNAYPYTLFRSGFRLTSATAWRSRSAMKLLISRSTMVSAVSHHGLAKTAGILPFILWARKF